MAEIAMNVVLFSLQQIIAREADLLIGVEEKVRWIETEFRLMVAYLESIDAQHQLHGHANDWAEKTRSVIRKTEDLIETYAKKASQSKMGAIYKRPIYLIGKRGLSVKLDHIKDEIVHVRQGWRSIDLGNNMSASSQDSRFSTVMEELDSALSVGHSVSLQDAIQWVRDELSPLHHFLQEIDRHHSFLCLGDRQKIWIRELRDIFDYVGTSLANSSNAPVFLNSFCSRKRVRSFKLRLAVPKIQRKILELYRVYHTYGLGEILVNNTSIFPRIRMATPIPYGWSSTSDLVERFLVHSLTFMVFNRTAGQSRMRTSYSSWLTPSRRKELLPLDLELMKALLDDTSSMRDLDRRMVVWLSQVSTNLESLVKLSSDVSLGRNDVFDRHKEIAVGIHDIAATRMNYGIGRALGEAGWLDPIAATSLKYPSYELSSTYPHLVKLFLSILGAAVISKTNLTRRVKSIRKDLQLMEALSHDVNRMEKLDTRLKIWVEEMQCVAGEANRVVNLDSANPFTRARAIRKINKIHNHILTISKWKHTYDIGDVKPMGECAAGTPNHNLEQKSYTSNDIDYLRSEIKLMHALKVDTYEAGGISEAWMEEMQNIAEDATKLVSRFDQMENDRCLSFLNSSRSFSGNSLRRDLDQVKYKIRQLSEIRIAYGIELTPRLPPDTLRQIKEKLVQRDHEHPCSIVPILGMRQTDKEALKDLIKYDSAITRHFVSHAWVNVPEDIISAASVLEHVTMQINEQGKKPQLLEEEPIVNELIKQEIVPTLDRWLIVLDEIRTIEVWQYLKQALQQISTGDRIIFISSEHTYSLLGSTSNAIRDMPVILRHLLPPLSTDHVMSLPSYLRQCLYYFALFPADFEVPTRRLIVLWVAEGLIRLRKNESESVEHVAECYLQKLIDKGLVQVTKEKPNGKPRACRIELGMRENLLRTAKEDRFFKDGNGIISRLVDHHDAADSCFIQIHGNPTSASLPDDYRKVFSFLSFDTQDGSKPGHDIGAFLAKCILAESFRSLRTLDLERVFRPKLPKELKELTLLRYLGLRWTYLEKLPKSISKLLNLQVLDVKHTYISTLPKSIWTMQYLRHLYLSETYRTKFDGRPSKISLNDLQTLWGAYIDENTLVKQGLDTTRNIRKLGLSCRPSSLEPSSPMSAQLDAVAEWISNLELLESLRLKSRDEHGKASDLHLRTLESNKNLCTVYLLGKLKPSVVEKFPRNLVEITLSGSELTDDPMEYMKHLPELLILRLLSQSVVRSTMHCSRGGFVKLKVLDTWKLENLEEWEVERGALPSLEELEIRSCENLTKLPHVENLKKYCLASMPETFINKSKEDQPELWAELGDVLQIR